VLSQQYGIEFWLERAYLDVCTTDDWLSDEDGLRLGVVVVLKIGRARHKLLRQQLTLKREALRLSVIRAVFGLDGGIGSPASMPASGFDSGAGEPNASADNATAPSPTPPSGPDAEVSLRQAVRGRQGPVGC
jgi:hypothetical protein